MSLEWSLREEELVIDFYGKHESLYNKNHADYNYNRKNKLLAELVKELNKLSGGKKFKVDVVSSHWNELRNIYNQHKRKFIKNELTGKKNAQTEPDWIWWRIMNKIFTGETEDTVDKNIRRQTSFVSNVVQQNDLVSPVKSVTRSKAVAQDVPNVNVPRSNRRSAIPSTEYDPPTKIYRRRTIHPVAVNNDIEMPPLNCDDDSETEFECEINVTPVAAKRPQKRVASLSKSIRQLSTTVPEKTPESKPVSSKVATKTSPEEESVTPKTRRGKLKVQAPITPMEIDTPAPQSVSDECASTAMFVQSRLRTYDNIKRQRIIFKIHELFFEEDV